MDDRPQPPPRMMHPVRGIPLLVPYAYRVCDYVGKEADAIDDPVAADGEEVEEDAEATALSVR